MSVLMANRQLGVRNREPATIDGHGDLVGGGYGPLRGPLPGRAEEQPDTRGRPNDRPWVLAVDPTLWPVAMHDLVIDGGSGQTWTVTSADLLANNAVNDVDYVRIEANLRTDGGTLP